MKKIVITGVGKCLPGEPVTNEYLLKALDLPEKINEDFIDRKIGIKQRHLTRHLPSKEECYDPNYKAGNYDWENKWGSKPGFRASDLSAEAIKNAANIAQIPLSQIDMLILTSATPDQPVPPTSTIVADLLGIDDIITSDIRSACSGSTQGLFMAQNSIQAGKCKCVAVVGVECGSGFGIVTQKDPHYDFGDTINALMMGDGASAFIVQGFEHNQEIKQGLEIVDISLGCVGLNKKPGMQLKGGGCVYPMSRQYVNEGIYHFNHDVHHVIKNGPILYMTGLNKIFENNNITLADLDLIVPHQANGQVRNIGKGLQVDPDKIFMNIDKVGNTGNASLGLCLDDIVQEKNYPKNSLIVLLAAESTKWLYGATLLKWHGSLTKKGENESGIQIKQDTNIIEKQKAKFKLWLIKKYLNFKNGAKL